MINHPRAIEIAAEFLRLRSALEMKLGQDFEKEILIYDFLHDKPDPLVSEALRRYRASKWALCRFLQEQDSVPEVDEREIRDLFEALASKNLDEANEPDFVWDKRMEELEETLLWQWWGPREYVQAYLKAKPLVAIGELPVRLQELIAEARRCYAFGQPNAVMAVCRMILEFAITDIGVRIGRFPAPESLDDFYSAYPPKERADKLLGRKGPRREKFKALYDAGSKAIHSSTDVSPYSALDYLQAILEFVSDEYAIHCRE